MTSQRTRAGRACRMLSSWLAFVACLLFASAAVDATTYVYDANGRLVTVTNESGESARYVYDVMGNMLRIERIAADELKIFAVTPSHGTVEAPVTIYGQGFSSQISDNTVTFNGTLATIQSATANQLKVTVPFGATTGPLTVKVAARSVTADDVFTVDDTGLPPTIASVAPDTVVPGAALTVSGAHLYPIAGKTSARIGGRSLDIARPANASLGIDLPLTASSGRVSVQTPYGFAESVNTVLVLPAGVTAASVVSRGVATVDVTPVSLSIPQGGQIGAVLFESRRYQWVSLQASAITTTAKNINYKVYAPGNVLVQQGTISAAVPSVHLSPLHASGTYLVTFQPDSAGAQLTVGVESNPTLAPSVPATVTTTFTGQTKRTLFAAQAGQTLAFQVSAMTTNPAGRSATYTVYTPNGTTYTSGTTTNVGLINLPNLPMSGTYQVVAAPSGATAASMQVGIIPGTTGSLSPGTPQTYTAKAPGQSVYLNFTAKTTDYFELVLSHATVVGATSAGFAINVYNRVGAQVASTTCYPTNPGGNCNLHLWYMAGGTYSVTITPTYGGTLHFDAMIQPHLKGPSVPLNGTTSIALGMGQVERFSFDANAGDTVGLQVSGVATTPTGQAMQFLVYRPDAGAITTGTPAYTNISPTSGQLVNLPNLPVSGTYTVIAVPAFGLPGNAQLSLVAGATSIIPSDGTSQTYNANAPGQNIYLNFSAKAGDNLELVLSHASVVGATSSGFSVNVTNRVGTQVASTTCYPTNPGGNCNLHLWYLAEGAYSVTVTPNYGGTLHFDALIQPNVTGPLVPLNGTTALSLGMGQVERFTFNANAGDTVALQVSGVTTTPAGQPIQFLVYRPDAGAITTATPAYSNFSPTSGQIVNLPNLPVGGTYTVVAVPAYGLPGSAQFTLVSGVTGSVPPDGTTQTYNANASGQNVYLNFAAKTGDNLEFVLSNVSIVGASSTGYSVNVYNRVGAQVASAYCYQNYPGGNCNLHLWNMAEGTYSVTVTPNYGGTLHFNAAIQPNVMGPLLPLNGTTALSLGMGQVERFTFNANAGDTVALQVSGVTTTPTGQSIQFLVYRPDAGAITTATPAYSNFSPTSGQIVNLPNLPVGGTYTVIAVPAYGLPGSAQFTLVSGVTGSVPPDGTTQTYNANASGQNVYLNFAAKTGDNLEFVLSNVSIVGASSTGYSVNVYNRVGAQVASAYCYQNYPGGNCNLHLWNMADGTYSVIVTPNYGGTLHFNAVIQPNAMGPLLPLNGTTSLSLGMGQVERFTFNANAGDTVALQVSGVTTTPAGQSIQFLVYRPDSGVITTVTPAYSNFSPTSGQLVNLPSLPVSGTYTVIAVPAYGLPGSAQFSLVSGVTGNIPSDGTTQTYSANASGQIVYLNFNANAADNLELVLSHVSIVGATSTGYSVNVYNQVGTQVASAYCYQNYPGGNCNLHLWNMAEGAYSVTVTPNYGGTLHFDAVVQPNVTGPLVPVNGTVAIALGMGQVERFTFKASAGDTVSLQVSGVTTAPVGQSIQFLVYRPDAGVITAATPSYSNFSPTSAQLVTLSNLPVNGTYTVIAVPAYGLPGSATFKLASQTAGQPPTTGTGTLPSNGSSQSYSASAAGQNVTLSFDANLGDNLELTFTNITAAGGSNNAFQVDIYNASGARLTEYYCYASNRGGSCPGHLWNLAAGTYSVVVSPFAGGKIGFNVLLTKDTIGSKLAPSVPTDISVAAGQVKRLTFDANRGDTVALQLSGVATTPAGGNVTVKVYRPDTGAITTSNNYSAIVTTSTSTLNLSNLPVGGTYTVTVEADYGIPASAQLTLFPGVADGVLTLGAPLSKQSNVTGQNIYLAFNASLGDNLELTFTNITAAGGTSAAFQVDIYNASGARVTEYYCYASNRGGSCLNHLWNLTAGIYSVVVSPYWGGKIGFNALLAKDVIGSKLTPSVPMDISVAAGQVKRLTFDANLGDTIALQLSGVVTTPAGGNVTVKVYRPDVGAITPSNNYTSIVTTGVSTLNLSDLPVGGTYTVTVEADYGIPASAQLTLFPGVADGVLTLDTPISKQSNIAGQNVYLTFDASLGDNLELTFTNITAAGGSSNAFQVDIYSANGTHVSNYYCYASNRGGSCFNHLWNLAAGTYSVVISPYWGGKIGFNALLSKDTIGSKLTPSMPTDISVTAGQVKRLTFDANLGDTIALQLSGVTTVPVGGNVTVKVYRPDVGAITPGNNYTTIATTGTTTLNLSNLPVGGTYTVTVEADYGLPANAQLTVFPGVADGVLSLDASLSKLANVPGQNVYMTFDANLGDNLQLTFTNITAAGGSSNAFQVDIYSANGTHVSNYYCYASNRGGSCFTHLWNLSAGTYSVVVSPYWGGKIGFTALLTKDTIASKLTPSAATDVGVAAGQLKRLTFDANRGDTVALQLSGVATTPTGGNVTVKVYRPDVGAITPSNNYSSVATTGTSTLNLANLPVGGTYTVTVEADYGLPASAQLTLFPGVADGVLSDGVVLSNQANVVAQNIYLTFNANLGDNMELTFNNITALGGTSNAFQVDVYSDNGTRIADYYCYASNRGGSCLTHLWNLSAGTYSVVVSPYWGGKIGFSALLTRNVTVTPLVLDKLVDMDLETGQVKRSSFVAEEGGTAVLQLSGVSTTPVGGNVTVKVYRPDVGAMTPSNYYATFAASGANVLNMTNLPIGGSYTVTIEADYGLPADARLGFSKTIGTVINAQ